MRMTRWSFCDLASDPPMVVPATSPVISSAAPMKSALSRDEPASTPSEAKLRHSR
eukprot:CAMPEP_0115145504 /NCGR_PEP_ID=MMETSP0227-20121206/62155_1 /TAXON_ID=89957 /ORGANISM="Polarella glacialis, Strain CCMP 1383" /LENGTH=54 /DNA_ID=CAMNT_0002555035 /DNA_START=36 /DNA_END=196 /DNA_ORIENTATION=+